MSLILVTGGAGFIGSNLVDFLLDQGYRVRVLDDLSSGKRQNLPLDNPSLEFIEASVEDAVTLERACADVDHVVHLAAMVSVPLSIKDPKRAAQINVNGFLGLLHQLHAQAFSGRLLYASSSAVYGADQPPLALKEEQAPGTLISPYAVDKYTNELYAQLFGRLYGLSTLGFRFFNVYGPRQDPSSDYSGVISIFMGRAARGQKLTVYGDGLQVRDFVYVGDLVRVLESALNGQANGVVNVGTGTAIAIRALAEQITELYSSNGAIEHQAARSGDIKHSCADTELLAQTVGYLPKTDLARGLLLLKESLTP